MRPLTASTLIFLAGFAGSTAIQPIWAAQPDEEINALRKDVESLKAGQEALRKEITGLKNLIKAQQQTPRERRSPIGDINASVNVVNDPHKGESSARVTMIEFSDYQCPFCSRHTRTVLPQLEKNYVETGKVKYVLRDFPLSFHKQAAKAHEAAHCAGEQDKYWSMHAQLFANQKALQAEQLPKHAQAAGLTDLSAFQDCLSTGKYEERVKASIAEGSKLGVRGTPTFAIGLTGSDGSVKAVKLIRGAQPYAVFQKTLDELLAAEKSGQKAAPKSGEG